MRRNLMKVKEGTIAECGCLVIGHEFASWDWQLPPKSGRRREWLKGAAGHCWDQVSDRKYGEHQRGQKMGHCRHRIPKELVTSCWLAEMKGRSDFYPPVQARHPLGKMLRHKDGCPIWSSSGRMEASNSTSWMHTEPWSPRSLVKIDIKDRGVYIHRRAFVREQKSEGVQVDFSNRTCRFSTGGLLPS